jgi:hypothetical protein
VGQVKTAEAGAWVVASSEGAVATDAEGAQEKTDSLAEAGAQEKTTSLAEAGAQEKTTSLAVEAQQDVCLTATGPQEKASLMSEEAQSDVEELPRKNRTVTRNTKTVE